MALPALPRDVLVVQAINAHYGAHPVPVANCRACEARHGFEDVLLEWLDHNIGMTS
jgi:hypothetical protein